MTRCDLLIKLTRELTAGGATDEEIASCMGLWAVCRSMDVMDTAADITPVPEAPVVSAVETVENKRTMALNTPEAAEKRNAAVRAAAQLKRETYDRLSAYIKYGGEITEVASYAGLPGAMIKAMIEGRKHSIDEWRCVSKALDTLEINAVIDAAAEEVENNEQ